MKKSNIIMGVTFLIAVGMIAKAFILNEDVKVFLLIFFAVGAGLGLLRLFVNSSIKKMKGKGWKSKVLFFGVLLGLGLPFQSWFRKNVLLSIDSAYLISSIMIMVIGVLFMTTCFGFISNKINAKSVTG
ncbi:MFS transporter permease [Neobacillus sp. FSL H8-0543]|uniref:MFS transporter permease n=1 Tax=Neobacillus sp. FSL H8-0543 TaxID=2954672 RepID=UPI003158B227